MNCGSVSGLTGHNPRVGRRRRGRERSCDRAQAVPGRRHGGGRRAAVLAGVPARRAGGARQARAPARTGRSSRRTRRGSCCRRASPAARSPAAAGRWTGRRTPGTSRPTARPRTARPTTVMCWCRTPRLPPLLGGGSSAIRFGADGGIERAYRILGGHQPQLRRRSDAMGHMALLRGARGRNGLGGRSGRHPAGRAPSRARQLLPRGRGGGPRGEARVPDRGPGRQLLLPLHPGQLPEPRRAGCSKWRSSHPTSRSPGARCPTRT